MFEKETTSMLQSTHAQTPTIQISVINESTVLTDAEVTPVVSALQKQVTNDFGPVWGTAAQLTIIPKGTQPPTGSWWLVMLDDSDQANALGYHDLTTEGLPIGKVFVASDLKAGTSWTVTASHELLEMLGDPNINLTVFVQNATPPELSTPTKSATPAKTIAWAMRSITSCFRISCTHHGLRASAPRAPRSSTA
jgi:hypothetical protein